MYVHTYICLHAHAQAHWYMHMLTYWFSFNYVRNWEHFHHLLAIAMGDGKEHVHGFAYDSVL
jgi:hypothetical protein